MYDTIIIGACCVVDGFVPCCCNARGSRRMTSTNIRDQKDPVAANEQRNALRTSLINLVGVPRLASLRTIGTKS